MSTKEKKKLSLITGAMVVVLVAGLGVFSMAERGVAESGDDKAAKEEAATEEAAAAETLTIQQGNPVVATVNGTDIMRSDVFGFIATLPEQVRQMPIQNLFPMALDQVINNNLISQKSENAKLENDEEVAKLMEQAKTQIIRNIYVDRALDKEVTEKSLEKAYKELVSEMEKVQETKARHILVDSEDKAKEVIAKLKKGSKFEDMVKEYSTGPSAEKGGELGWFAKSEMVPEFAEAAFAVKKGDFSKEAVKTQFGWHIIKVDDRRQRPEPKFEDVKPQLEAQLRQKTLGELLDKWQKDSKVKKFDINGEPVKDAKSN